MGALIRKSLPLLRPLTRLSTTTTTTVTTTTSFLALSLITTPSTSTLPTQSRQHPSSFASLPHNFFSTSSSGPSNFIVVNSEEDLRSSISKAEDGALPSVFYFTAVWCGPCRFISPLVEELSKKYPHVMTYKIDIDLDGLGSTLNKMQISAVPTLHFFHNGKKAAEMVGADAAKLKETMEKLYKRD